MWLSQGFADFDFGGIYDSSDASLFLLSHQLRSEKFTREDTHWPLSDLEAETREGEGDVDLD